jgi:hypothetical protein
MPTPRPIVTQLDRRTRATGIRYVNLAAQIGCHFNQVCAWKHGRKTPRFASFVTWANHVGCSVAAIDTHGNTLALDADIPPRMADWRRAAGLTQLAVARRRYVTDSTIARLEAARQHGLATVEDHLAALNIRLVLVPAQMREVA